MSRQRGERVRPERLAEQIRVDTALILQSELKDPRLPLVTCTRVSVTGDLKQARIYVSVLGNEAEQKRAMEVLERATGYVRRLLSQRLGLRSSPEIRFQFDPSVEYGIRLEELLKQIRPHEPDEADPVTGEVVESSEEPEGD